MQTKVFTLSTLFLVLANLVPVAGAIYLDWDLSSILLIYWVESAVIGLFNFFKILVIGGLAALFTGLFFIAHFGAFMAVLLMFLNHLFIAGVDSSTSISIETLFLLVFQFWPAVVALFISHGISFMQNFLGHKEFLERSVAQQMHEPYQRIIFMQLVIIIGAWLTSMLGDSTIVLLLIITAKIVVDIRSHVRERSTKQQTSGIN